MTEKNPLSLALMQALQDPDSRAHFYRVFCESTIYFIQNNAEKSEHTSAQILEANSKVSIRSFSLEGQTYLPIFSSLTHLQQALTEPASYMAMNAMEFMRLTQGAFLFLDYATPYAKPFSNIEVAAILDGSIFSSLSSTTTSESSEILLGVAENYPHALVDALKHYLKDYPQISRAWIAHFYNPKDELPPHTLLALESVEGLDKVLENIASVLDQVEIPEPPLDIVQINSSQGIGHYFLHESQPFYQVVKH
ncbi:enhanced serine sensitivity protein SseB C-terminal domain-containing protein [Pseudomonas sp. F1_0610]|uniref:enhanced serine sensitivity protein SseB C-terminal domain-containing protein n=1 Tax=Pseudomonas sp. F1_0610 TaxID=3114284 RepID=UPI0039C31DDC